MVQERIQELLKILYDQYQGNLLGFVRTYSKELDESFFQEFHNYSEDMEKSSNAQLRHIGEIFKQIEPTLQRHYTASRHILQGTSYYLIQGERELAISEFDKALELSPDYVEALIARSDLYNRRGEYDRAIADANHAMEIDSQCAASAYSVLGEAYRRRRQYDEAIISYKKAIDMGFSDTEYVSYLAGTYYERGLERFERYEREHAEKYLDAAFDDFNEGVALEPDNPFHFLWRGILFNQKHCPVEAISDLTEFIQKIRPFEMEKKPKEKEIFIEIENAIMQAYSERGTAYQSIGKDDEAIIDFTKAIERNPKKAQTLFNRGFSYTRQQKWKQAVDDLSKVIELVPKSIDFQAFLAQAYFYRGTAWFGITDIEKGRADYQQAIALDSTLKGTIEQMWRSSADFTQAIKLNPNLKSFVEELIAESQNAPRSSETNKTIINETNSHEPSEALDCYMQGMSSMKAGDHTQALAYFSRAIELNPEFADAFATRAGFWHETDNFDKAIKDASRAIELQPQLARAFLVRGVCYSRQKKTVQALADLEKAMELKIQLSENQLALLLLYRSISLHRIGNHEQALTDLDKALELNSEYTPRIYCHRGSIWMLQGDLDKAIMNFTKAIELKPQLAEAFYFRGLAEKGTGELGKAISDFSKVIDFQGEYVIDAYYERGIIESNQGNNKQAIADLTKAIEMNPRHAKALTIRANIWGKEGDEYRALADYSESIKIDPHEGGFLGRGLVWYAKGDYEQAITDFTKAIEFNPNVRNFVKNTTGLDL